MKVRTTSLFTNLFFLSCFYPVSLLLPNPEFRPDGGGNSNNHPHRDLGWANPRSRRDRSDRN